VAGLHDVYQRGFEAFRQRDRFGRDLDGHFDLVLGRSERQYSLVADRVRSFSDEKRAAL